MKQRLVLLALAAGCIVLALAGVLVWLGKDHRAPEITVEEREISYTEGESYDVLLEGVTAKDNVDGDLTDEVFVERILQTSENSAVVYYGVMDKSHNVGTGRRTVEYHPGAGGAGGETDQAEGEENGGGQAEEQGTDGQEAAADMQAAQQQEEVLQPNGVRPALALTASETVIAAGTAFDPMSVVRDAVDDVDTRDFLFQRISANGIYDTNVPGTYTIEYFVSDSSGNTSDPQIFTLIVQ